MGSNNLIVTKHNDLIEASYKLTLEEQRLLLSCIAQIDSRLHKNVPDKITITASEYADQFGIQLKHAYEQLKKGVNRLYERDIKIKTNGEKERLRWVYRVTYYEKRGYVSLKFSPDVKPYLGQLNGFFRSYQLKNISSLKSTYSIRLYELLNQWKDTGKRFIKVSDLRDMLQLQERYPRYADMKRWVIEPAVKELNEKTDLVVEYNTEKQGRKVVKLSFFFSTKSQISMAL